MAEADPDADVMRIMIATDNHLGYMEKDPIRRNDSFEAFEEIFQQVRLKVRVRIWKGTGSGYGRCVSIWKGHIYAHQLRFVYGLCRIYV